MFIQTVNSTLRQVTLIIPRIPNSPCCPVQAWRNYKRKVKPNSSGPALNGSNQVRMSIASVAKPLSLTLSGLTYPDSTSLTLHAVKKGAVHGCIKAGTSRTQIKDLGLWASNSVVTYLPPKSIKRATSTLTAYFG